MRIKYAVCQTKASDVVFGFNTGRTTAIYTPSVSSISALSQDRLRSLVSRQILLSATWLPEESTAHDAEVTLIYTRSASSLILSMKTKSAISVSLQNMRPRTARRHIQSRYPANSAVIWTIHQLVVRSRKFGIKSPSLSI